MNKWVKRSLAGLAFALFTAIVYRVVLFEVVTRQFDKMGEQFVEKAQKIQQQTLAHQEKLVQLQREKDELKSVQLQQLAQVEAERQRREREHEKAFLAAYKAPAGCDNWISDAHMVECVNHRMRAKAALDSKSGGH